MAREKANMHSYFVAAIDLGTTFSNFAYALQDELKDKSFPIYSRVGWEKGVMINQKTPTVILFHPNGEFHSFGKEAEQEYSDLASQGRHQGWKYFNRFKMELDRDDVDEDMDLIDDQANPMAATDVIAASIKYLKQEAIQNISEKIPVLKESDIRWVLTIPAMWRVKAKKIMVAAAEKAGIPRAQLVLAYEPVAAALYSKERELAETLDEKKRRRLKENLAGLKFMIIDLGGGTVDVMTFKVKKNGTLKSLDKPSGGPWGGVLVDKAFNAIMSRAFGKDVFGRWQQEFKAESLELDQTFEQKKKTISKDTENTRIKINHHLWDAFKEKRGREFREVLINGQNLRRQTDKLDMTSELAVGMFRESVELTLNFIDSKIKKLYKKHKVDTIVLTGGFSESKVIQEAFRRRFTKYEVVSTRDAELAVVMGAVIYGSRFPPTDPEELLFSIETKDKSCTIL